MNLLPLQYNWSRHKRLALIIGLGFTLLLCGPLTLFASSHCCCTIRSNDARGERKNKHTCCHHKKVKKETCCHLNKAGNSCSDENCADPTCKCRIHSAPATPPSESRSSLSGKLTVHYLDSASSQFALPTFACQVPCRVARPILPAPPRHILFCSWLI